MTYRGDIAIGSTVDFKFTTRQFSSGAPHSFSAGDIIAFVGNGTGTVSAGITLTANFGGFAGLNHVRWVASAANGYSASTDVMLVVKAGSVDGVSVAGEVIAEYSIEKRVVASVIGAVGSVTGAVGSVTGNVGGNVAGSVNSVTQAVGISASSVAEIQAGLALSADVQTANTAIAAIKLKTDRLTFDADDVLAADIQKINGVTIVGDGSGTPFNV